MACRQLRFRDVGSIVPQTEPDLAVLRRQNKGCWSAAYWRRAIGDNEHFAILEELKCPTAYKLLYDSWVWYLVLKELRLFGDASNVLELLPGTSLTIPIALHRGQFQGTLDRVDDGCGVPSIRSTGTWYQKELIELLGSSLNYDFIVGNHVIDDMLIALEYPELAERHRFYASADLSRQAWARLARSSGLRRQQDRLVKVFRDLVERMKLGSVLVLRHYPPTFAIISGDNVRIELELKTYFTVAEGLTSLPGTKVGFLDLSGLRAPQGSKYPHSFLVLRKGRPP